MKKLIILLIGTDICNVGLDAQHNKQVTKQQLELLKKSTLYVVMDDDPAMGYNIAVKSAVDHFWKLTPFKYISLDEFENQKNDKRRRLHT